MIKKFERLSLKNKFIFSMLAVILVISAAVALMARWILVNSLNTELELRGSAIAHSLAERSGPLILDKDYPKLLSLIYDEATLHERRHLVSYIFVKDADGKILSHTFTRPFPKKLRHTNTLPQSRDISVKLATIAQTPVYDIAVPIKEGIYRIGTVHVGLNKKHMDQLVSTLRITFLGFLAMVVVIIFFVSQKLAGSITEPITKLRDMSDQISRGDFDINLDLGYEKGEIGWDSSKCPAYNNTELPCWHFDDTSALDNPEQARKCAECVFYKKSEGDEVVQLADSFRNMIWSIKLYRRRLRESEEKYRSLFASGPDPIFVVDCNTCEIIDANPRAEELYGYARGELRGRSFIDLGPDYNEACVHFFLDNDIETASGCVYYPKILHYKKNKKPFFVNMHACPTSYRGKHSAIIAVTDVTEMMEKDAQLVQASKMKSLGEMSAGVAHELNQPLNAIKLGSQYLYLLGKNSDKVEYAQFKDVLEEISAQVDRAAEIINTLRSFGRKAELISDEIDLNKPINAVLTLVRRQFTLDNIDLELDLGKNLPKIKAHDNRLQQVVFNLLTNARDALAETGRGDKHISIKTYARNSSVVAEIADNGPGMPEAIQDKIFEPFFTTKKAGQGMGLGLAITYGIVKDYGGEIKIDSKTGQGTAFQIVFPALEP